MNTAFLAGERTDAMYMRDEDAAEWAEAKWALPLDNMPGAKDLTKDEYPFITEQTNYKGKKYGTIYYVGPRIAFYNKEHLKQAGFSRPPATWDEFRQQAVQIKRQRINGVEFPRYGAPGEGDLENWYLASGQAHVRRRPAAHLRQGRPLQGHGGQAVPGLHRRPDLRARLRRARRPSTTARRPTPGAPSTT